MRIGLFTDSYHPASNGVVVVVDSLRRELEAAGHEVYIFAPDASVAPRIVKLETRLRHKMEQKIPDALAKYVKLSTRQSIRVMPTDPHIIRLPAFQYDMQLSLFFPPRVMQTIRDLKLDVIQFFTPGQLGLMASYAARKTGAVLIGQHSTDVYGFSKAYPGIVLGCFLGGFFAPIIYKMSLHERRDFTKLYFSRRRFESDEKWGQRLVAGFTAVLYAGCDGVVAVSSKSADQLQQFARRIDEKLTLRVIPTGVNAIERPKDFDKKLSDFRTKFSIAKDDEVILNFGRMAEEKNLPLLITVLEYLVKTRPKIKLLFAGDYLFRDQLEALAQRSPVADRIVFVGRYKRQDLPIICAVAKIFVFPSLTDTQALVLNEAAGQHLPIVMIDQNINEVFHNNENGLLARNSARDFAKKCEQILNDEKLRQNFAQKSGELAGQFYEKDQTAKLIHFYRELLRTPLK